jgi:hypothetical protein
LNELRLETLAGHRAASTKPALAITATDTVRDELTPDKGNGLARDAGSAASESLEFTVAVTAVARASSEASGVVAPIIWSISTLDGTTPTIGIATLALARCKGAAHSMTTDQIGESDVALAPALLPEGSIAPTGTFRGTATVRNQRDTFTVNAQAHGTGGPPGDPATLSFTGSAVGDHHINAAFCSVQMDRAGSLALGAGYCSVVTISPPSAGALDSTGSLMIQVRGPGSAGDSLQTC